MNLERDLRDAMQPLHGDAVGDAARVLGALGPAPTPGPFGLPKATWWLGTAALVLGALGGWAVAQWTRSAAQPAKVTEPAKAPAKDAPKDPEPKDPVSEWQLMALQYADKLRFTAFGEIAIDEPGVGPQVLDGQAPAYDANVGTTFKTVADPVGIYLYANDARVRLGSETTATVEAQMVVLTKGRVWLSDITRPALVRIRTDLGLVEVDAATAIVERRAGGLWVCSLKGTVVVRPEGGTSVRLLAMQQVEIDARRGPGPVEKVPFAGTLTGWMSKMILQQQDPAELYQRLDYLVEAFVGGAHRDAATVELRRLGSHAVPRLYESLAKIAADPALVLGTVALLTDLAEFTQNAWLFALLERNDAETRSLAFRALVRIIGVPVEDEAFWRTGPPGERDAALLRWRQLVR